MDTKISEIYNNAKKSDLQITDFYDNKKVQKKEVEVIKKYDENFLKNNVHENYF
jgi:hypothetical protein